MKIEIIDPSRIIGADLARTIRRAMHRDTPRLRDSMIGRLIDRTPQLTGALRRDETGTYNSSDYDDPELIHLYTGSENQVETWHKVYAPYVEGPPLGDPGIYSTLRGDYAHMFMRAKVEDVSTVQDWGFASLQSGVNDIVSGKSLRL